MSDRKSRLTITVDPDLSTYAERLVASGQAASVSAAFNEAMAEKAYRDRRRRGLWKARGDQADPGRVARMMATSTSSLPVSEVAAPPLVLDTSVVTAVARGDPDIIGLIQGYDAHGRQLVIPALAIAGALLDGRSEEADDLLGGLELLDNATIAPLRGTEQAARLADIIARTGLDPWGCSCRRDRGRGHLPDPHPRRR